MKQNDSFLSFSRYLLLFLAFCVNSVDVFSQCAGDDTTMTICIIPANQTVDLFSNLNGSPVSGGIWDNAANPAISINTSTGVVDIWQIIQGGSYSFTYTVNAGSCNDVSTFTLTVGGYAGEDDFQANACEDDTAVNLFQFIGSDPNPHLFGTWSDDSNTGALSANFYNAAIQGPGTYNFTYTVPAVGSCPAQSSLVILTVHPLPDPGEGATFTICGLDELANFSIINLEDHHTGGDPGGVWSEDGTSQITSTVDHTVNAQDIYTNFGYGRYDFTYTVLPDHPVCSLQTATITIEILQEIDLTAVTMEVNSLCEDEVGILDLTVLFSNVPNLPELLHWDYEFDYEITGPVNYSGTVSITMNSPGFSFNLPSGFVPSVGNYTIIIPNITVTNDEDNIICNILHNLTATFEIRELPNIDDVVVDIPPICVGEDATVSITDPSLDGIYDITYTLSGANSTTQTISTDFINGNHTFVVDGSLLSNSGTTIFTIVHVNDGLCEVNTDVSVSFEVNPLPDTGIIEIIINDSCLGEPVQIVLQNLGGPGQIEITYELTGVNPLPQQTAVITVSNGIANFTLPSSSFPNLGITTFQLTYVTDLTTGCGDAAQITEDFEVFPLPPPPIVSGPQEFCKSANPTIADLVPNGTGFSWFGNQADLVPLSASSALVSGTYWLGAVSSQGCVSDKTPVQIIVNNVPPLTLVPGGASFCGADNPTISDLTQNTQHSGSMVVSWWDANGNELDPNEALADGVVYYGYVQDLLTNCKSATALEVRVSLTNCPGDPQQEYDFFIPDAFSPNDDGVNDVFRITDIQFLYPNYTFEIYNRWGKLLFVGDIDAPEWNGTTTAANVLIDGIVPNGVYFYVVYFNKDDISPRQGRLYLNR